MQTIHATPMVLNAAPYGLELARSVSILLSRGESVRVDFSLVERATPSFANAFMMTLLHQFERDILRSNIHFTHARPTVIEALNASIRRYDSGIRLSSQRTSQAS